MGNLKTFFVAMVLLLSGSAVMAGPSEDQSIFPGGRNQNLFVVKTGKELIGAKVEIYSASGDLITTQITQKRKMYIDFNGATLGTYTIKLTKGETVKEFNFRKK
jgi:hypothetical protein